VTVIVTGAAVTADAIINTNPSANAGTLRRRNEKLIMILSS
jgi:hypothetical protein